MVLFHLQYPKFEFVAGVWVLFKNKGAIFRKIAFLPFYDRNLKVFEQNAYGSWYFFSILTFLTLF